MFKQFIQRKLLERQLKNMPKEQQALIMGMMQKDPKLFERIAADIQAEMKKGKNQMSAAMTVMPKYRNELAKLNMGGALGGQIPTPPPNKMR